jgi:hypothetical protein
MELECGERKRFSPILGEKERNDIMIGTRTSSRGVFRNLIKSHGARGLGAILLVE